MPVDSENEFARGAALGSVRLVRVRRLHQEMHSPEPATQPLFEGRVRAYFPRRSRRLGTRQELGKFADQVCVGIRTERSRVVKKRSDVGDAAHHWPPHYIRRRFLQPGSP